MRKKTLLVGLILCLVLLPGKALAAPSYQLGGCTWMTIQEQSCTPKQWLHQLFYLPPGPVIGCRAKPGKVSLRGMRGKKKPWVALTFDDGPSIYTPRFLSILRDHNVKASFFLIGNQIPVYPQLVQKTTREGHLIGNHSWNHPMLSQSKIDVQQQLNSTQKTIQSQEQFKPCIMRPPYGAWNSRVQKETARQGLQIILWDVDTQDWSKPGVNKIVRLALSQTRPGSIILMHDGGGERSQTLQALPQIIRGLKQRGYQIVRLDKILGIKLTREHEMR